MFGPCADRCRAGTRGPAAKDDRAADRCPECAGARDAVTTKTAASTAAANAPIHTALRRIAGGTVSRRG
jgi:hypothetical protein